MHKYTLLTLLLLSSNTLFSQVREVKNNVERDKNSNHRQTMGSSSSYVASSAPDSDDFSLGAYLVGAIGYYTFYAAFIGVRHAQVSALHKSLEKPELVSLQSRMIAGYSPDNNAGIIMPSFRGNYGIFASDLRYTYTSDVTGSMQAIDWQVVKVRVPIGNVKLEHGLGFSRFVDPGKFYFERTVGFDWTFIKRIFTLQGEFRWSEDTSFGRYRVEYSAHLDFEAARRDRLLFCPTIGIIYQEYFGSTQFTFISAGLVIRMY